MEFRVTQYGIVFSNQKVYNRNNLEVTRMTTSDMIRQLCKKMDISISELARKIGQSPQNFNKKMQRETISYVEMIKIANALGITYEQTFMLANGEKISLVN